MRPRTVQYIAVGVAAGCLATLPTYAGAADVAPSQAEQAAHRDKGSWKQWGAQFNVSGRYWYASDLPQNRWDFRFHRGAKHNGKRQVRVRRQYVKGLSDPKPGRWHKTTKRIRPGGQRRVAFRAKRCGKNLGLVIDVLVRRNKPKHPKRWGKWEYGVAIYSGRACK